MAERAGTRCLCDRGESRRGSTSGRKVADRRRLEHDGAKVFQAAEFWRTAELGPGLCQRIHERIQKDASPGVNPIKEILSTRRLLR
jgi:hypothetical protein